MRVTFLGQGFEPTSPNSVGNKLMDFLSSNDYDSFFGISAFASAAGVKGLSNYLEIAKPNFRDLKIIVGIDQNGTSVEALEEILALGIDSYIFYQKESPIFHPKIYLFEGDNQSKIILGSSNLTANGLFSNHEGSLMVEFDSTDVDGLQLLNEIKDYYSTLFDLSDPNLFEINRGNIDSFLNDGVISREPKRVKQNKKVRQSTTRSIAIPDRVTPTIPSEFRRPRRSQSSTKTTVVHTSSTGDETVYERGQLAWVRKRLPASSVQSAGSGTNPTGGLRLVQDGFVVSGHVIDQTSYFRNTVFGALTWNTVRTTPYVEGAEASFFVTVRGDVWGLFDLEIRHKPTGEAGQHNYTTSISWGALGERIRGASLTNARLELYSPNTVGDPFIIEII